MAHVARIFDISTSIHQVYTAYYGNSNTSLDKYHMDGTQRYTRLTAFHYCMIVPWCLPLVTAFILCTPCTHCVDIVTLVLRIRNVHICYTYGTHLSTKRYIVYTTCIHPVSFF